MNDVQRLSHGHIFYFRHKKKEEKLLLLVFPIKLYFLPSPFIYTFCDYKYI